MKLARRTLLAGLAAQPFVAQPIAAQPFTAVAEGAHDIPAIQDRGALRIAIANLEAAPFFSSASGTLRGTDIDLGSGLAGQLGVPVRFIRTAPSFDAVVDQVVNGEADIAISKLSISLPRARRVLFSAPYLVLRHALAVSRLRFARLHGGQDMHEVLADFRDRLGVIAHSSYEGFAGRNFPLAEIVALPGWDDVVAAVREGDLLAGYRDEFEIRKLALQDPALALTVRTVTITDVTDEIGIALPPEAPKLAAFVNLYLRQTPQPGIGQLLEMVEQRA